MRDFRFPIRPAALLKGFTRLSVSALLAAIVVFQVQAQGQPSSSRSSTPSQTSGSSAAEAAIRKFRVAPGLQVDLTAAEPLLANPVSFTFDEQGRLYVVETHRRRTSVYDIRNHPDWVDADLSFRTVLDRSNFLKQVLSPTNTALPPKIRVDRNNDGQFDYKDLEVESERIQLLEDLDGDGRMDRSTVFADDFKTLVSGVAAGVLARKGHVWFTCIPDLWLLRDTNNDRKADLRTRLLDGFGVHISFGGHDLHGLCIGPDGKLYFSIADRGLHVRTRSGTIAYPDSGAVLRCNLDGSELELFATGLRNPQELAFDQHGNLWTGDNNGDAGDKARLVYVVEGSESGWHAGWQHLPRLGAWNSEKLWELAPRNTAAYLLPPVAHIGHGPAGISFYPGTGLPARYDNHFFMADFPGGIRSFALRPRGAGYEVVDLHDFLWELYPVDVGFGPAPGLYVADWIEGWEKTGKGRIYRIHDPAMAEDPLFRQTQRLLAEGMDKRSTRELIRLLGHPDQRVRLEAQFALAARGETATNNLAQTAARENNRLARLHAIWALGQIGRTNRTALGLVVPLLKDSDPEVRAQAVKVLGDGRYQPALDHVARSLQDPHPRVRFFSAMALGKLDRPEAAELLVETLRENGDQDLFVRHAAVMGLVWLEDINPLLVAAKDPSDSVRLGALLALRRLERPEAAMFLYDSNPKIVLEAARAIYDVPLPAGFSQLAALSSKSNLGEPVLRRALNAHFRLGQFENALALAEYAARKDAPEAMRIEALELLAAWAKPPGRDRILGLWRPLNPRETMPAVLALRSELGGILDSAPESVRTSAIQAAARLGITQMASTLRRFVLDTNRTTRLRAQALNTLAEFQDPNLVGLIQKLDADPDPTLRKEVNALKTRLNPAQAADLLIATLERGSLPERQAALKGLAGLPGEEIDSILLASLNALQKGQIAPELQLDVLEAAAARESSEIQSKLKAIQEKAKEDPLAAYAPVLFGGNPEAGRTLFFERAEAACLRCHKIHGEGGEVGPDLTGIGARQSRQYLLESILLPNKQITPGFGTEVVTMKSGTVYSGTVKSENENDLVLNSPEDGIVLIKKSLIESREPGLSAMPEELASFFTKRELRDLVEFLARLR